MFKSYLIVGSTFVVIKPKKERSRFGGIRTIRSVYISRLIKAGSKISNLFVLDNAITLLQQIPTDK